MQYNDSLQWKSTKNEFVEDEESKAKKIRNVIKVKLKVFNIYNKSYAKHILKYALWMQ